MKAFARKYITVIALGTVFAASTVRAETWTQTASATYNWNDFANWGGGSFPNATDATANISGDFAGAQTINLNQAITVGSLTTEDTGAPTDSAVTIAAGGGSLAFAVSMGSASLVQNSGVATIISSGVAFNSDTTISGSGALTLSGATTVASGKTLTISNTGGTTVSGASTFSGSLAVNSALTLSSSTGASLTGLSGAGTITKSTTGNVGLTLSGDNSAFTGALVLSGNNTNSRLFLSADNNLGASGVGITFTNVNQISFTVTGVTLAATRTFTVNSGATVVFTAVSGTNNVTTVNSKITGAGSVTSLTTGTTTTLVLGNAANDFTGSLNLTSGGLLSVSMLADSGVASGAGAGSTVVYGNGNGGGGSLVYTGSANASSNRLLQIASDSTITGTTSAQVINNGTGTVSLTNTTNFVTVANNGVSNLTLGGTNSGANSFGQIVNASTGSGLVNFFKKDAGTWRLANTANTYTGVTTIAASGGVLEVVKLANGGSTSSIGASTNAATNLLIGNAGTLRYVGAGDSTNRLFTINGTSTNGQGATLDASGTGAINFTNTGAIALGTTNFTRTLTLRGTNTGANTLAALIANNGTGAVSLIKQDAGKWILSNTNTYTGTTAVNGGILSLGAPNVINNSATNGITLGGGTLQSAFSQNLGLATLSLTAGTASFLDLSTGGTFFFADSSLATWGSGSTLSIVGTFTDSSSVRFGTTNLGLTSGQLGQITINGLAAGIDASGYLTAIAIPEPSTYALFVGALALAGVVWRSRKRRG